MCSVNSGQTFFSAYAVVAFSSASETRVQCKNAGMAYRAYDIVSSLDHDAWNVAAGKILNEKALQRPESRTSYQSPASPEVDHPSSNPARKLDIKQTGRHNAYFVHEEVVLDPCECAGQHISPG